MNDKKVVWSPESVDDLDSISKYIAVDSEAYAQSVVMKILRKARTLNEFPMSGRVVPEFRREGLRKQLMRTPEGLRVVDRRGLSNYPD
ncbi:MAG: type II toxin-antitoxin system RelE/ParE family toxin [Ignavibacteriae bacterium]|nr:type II toxin-antitoxin system RelE/ParE family toxin [Ignavibacteriota bacterium]